MTRPFQNLRVIDFSQVIAAPYAAAQLALLGADVIKVEPPKGDDARNMNPVKGPKGEATSCVYMAVNANKRSIVLDLKRPEAVEAARRLVATADVVIENNRPGVMDRLGLGWDVLSALNPRLIYCSVTGFGQEGPERTTPAYDGKIQAMSGIMSVTGEPDRGPMRAGFAVCDTAAGMTGAFAIAAALFQRTVTGKGQRIDLAMFDSTLAFMAPTVADWTVGGVLPEQMGNMASSRRPTADLFPTGNGWLLLACNSEGQFRSLMGLIGRPELLDDPRFVDWPTRLRNAADLRAILEEAFAREDADTLEERLGQGGVPAARVRNVAEAVSHPQMAHRKVVVPFEEHGISLLGAGYSYAHGGPSIDRLPPVLGEHTVEVLREAGFGEAEIEALTAT